MRGLFVLAWAVLIFVMTCTVSSRQLLEEGKLEFVWNSSPNVQVLFAPLPAVLDSSFINQKIGHVLVFFIFTLLLALICRSLTLNLAGSFLFAFITEFLQLYFMRHGRLFDVAFDGIGIVTAIVILGLGRLLNWYFKTRTVGRASIDSKN